MWTPGPLEILLYPELNLVHVFAWLELAIFAQHMTVELPGFRLHNSLSDA